MPSVDGTQVQSQLATVLTRWITHSSAQLPAVCLRDDEKGEFARKASSSWEAIPSFDAVIGLHLVDLTQLFAYDADLSLVAEMATEDRSLPWQRMELTAAIIVNTLRGMQYDGGGGEIERLTTAAIIDSQYPNMGSQVYTRYLKQRRREQGTLDHRKAFPQTKLYTNALSKHTTLAGLQSATPGAYQPLAEQVHGDAQIRRTIAESDGVSWTRMSSTELLKLLRLGKSKVQGPDGIDVVRKINEHPLFAAALSEGRRHQLHTEILQTAIEEDKDIVSKPITSTLLFVPLQNGIPKDLTMNAPSDVLQYIPSEKVPVLAVLCNRIGVVERLWFCTDPGAALAPLVASKPQAVELCSCALMS